VGATDDAASQQSPAGTPKAVSPKAGSRAVSPAGTPRAGSPKRKSGGAERSINLLRMKLREAAQTEVQDRKEKRVDMQQALQAATTGGLSLVKKGDREDGLVASGDYATVSDLYLRGKRLGTLHSAKCQLFIQLVRRGVSRKDVIALLRSLTYNNTSSDPAVLQKLVRITLKDNGHTVSQALVQVEIQSVDDVTEVVLLNGRPRYRPGSLPAYHIGGWAMCPLYRAALVDPDTEFFDGGALGIELTGGGVKGDTLGLMSKEQQLRSRKEAEEFLAAQRKRTLGRRASAGGQEPVWELETFLGAIEMREGKLFAVSASLKPTQKENEALGLPPLGLEIGTVEFPKAPIGGCNCLKVTFSNHSPPRISLMIASYVLNCVTYHIAAGAKLQPGQRTYIIKIRDGENPLDGRQRCIVDVARPIIVSDKQLLDRGCPTLEKPPNAAVQKTAKVGGEPVVLLDRPAAHIGDGKKDTMLTNGFTQIAVLDGAVEGDVLGFTSAVTMKDQSLQWQENYIGKLAQLTPHLIRVEHGWASRTTSRALSAVLGTVTLALSKTTRSGHQNPRVVEFQTNDGVSDSSCIRVHVTPQ